MAAWERSSKPFSCLDGVLIEAAEEYGWNPGTWEVEGGRDWDAGGGAYDMWEGGRSSGKEWDLSGIMAEAGLSDMWDGGLSGIMAEAGLSDMWDGGRSGAAFGGLPDIA